MNRALHKQFYPPLVTPTLQSVAQRQTSQSDTAPLTFADLRIRTKDKRVIPFAPNAVQEKYLDLICPRWREGDYKLTGQREIILKARQFGFSTLILALLFLDTINNPNTQTVVIAHDIDSTTRLFQMVQRFYNSLPDEKRPRTQYANRREFLWPDLGSSFFVGTAGNGEFGRGSTINNVHASEIGMWPNAEEIMAGLMQAVPADGNVFQESTAKGVGNYFHEEFERAQSGESALHARFFAWFEHVEYQGAPITDPSEEEQRLQSLYDLSAEQIGWRRAKLREPGMRTQFVQEYPANPREAFISSGNPYFDMATLEDLAKQLGDAVFDPIPFEAPAQFVDLAQIPRVWGRYAPEEALDSLMVWELPVEGEIYVIGADTAEGINDFGDHDFHSASVWRVSDGAEVARLHTRSIEAHEYGLALADLGLWYNTALLGVERNNHGAAVLAAIRFTKKYPDALHDTSTGLYLHQAYDEKKNPRERRAGYPTDKISKYFVLDELAAAIEDGHFRPRSRQLVADMMRFVKKKGGKAGAETGHDDRVMDAALARRMLNLRPRKPKPFYFVP